MPRRREIAKREILPDPKYNNQLVAKFINCLLKRGKKSISEAILYVLLILSKKRLRNRP